MTEHRPGDAGWQKAVSPPPAGSRPGGLPNPPQTQWDCDTQGHLHADDVKCIYCETRVVSEEQAEESARRGSVARETGVDAALRTHILRLALRDCVEALEGAIHVIEGEWGLGQAPELEAALDAANAALSRTDATVTVESSGPTQAY